MLRRRERDGPGHRPPAAGLLLLTDYERERFLGRLTLDDRPRLERIRVRSGKVRQGEWLSGYVRGSRRHFLAVYWTVGRMWVCDRDGPRELQPFPQREEVTWRARGSSAQLLVTRDGDEVLRYTYRRTRAQHSDPDEFPEHDLPRWLAHQWNDPDVSFAPHKRDGGLYAATWVE